MNSKPILKSTIISAFDGIYDSNFNQFTISKKNNVQQGKGVLVLNAKQGHLFENNTSILESTEFTLYIAPVEYINLQLNSSTSQVIITQEEISSIGTSDKNLTKIYCLLLRNSLTLKEQLTKI